VAEVAVACIRPKPRGLVVGKALNSGRADSRGAATATRRAGMQRETVGVVHLGAIILALRALVLAEGEHAGKRAMPSLATFSRR